jgi:hypothetical protein
MWMLAWVPDNMLLLAVHVVLVTGLIGTFLSFFLLHRIVRWLPALAPWHLLLQIFSMILLIGGVYFKGGYDTEAIWRAKVKEAEAKVAVAEQQANEANAELEKKGGEKIKYIQGRTKYITEYVDREVVKYDVKFAPGGECELPKEFVKSLNMAAERPTK